METRKRSHWLKPPCPQCPYTLGQIHTVVNPCPQCKLNGYQSYKWFRKLLSGECPDPNSGTDPQS